MLDSLPRPSKSWFAPSVRRVFRCWTKTDVAVEVLQIWKLVLFLHWHSVRKSCAKEQSVGRMLGVNRSLEVLTKHRRCDSPHRHSWSWLFELMRAMNTFLFLLDNINDGIHILGKTILFYNRLYWFCLYYSNLLGNWTVIVRSNIITQRKTLKVVNNSSFRKIIYCKITKINIVFYTKKLWHRWFTLW